MELFKFWGFGSKSEEQKARAAAQKAMVTLDIDVAISAHANWKARLLGYLDSRSSEDLRPEVICDD